VVGGTAGGMSTGLGGGIGGSGGGLGGSGGEYTLTEWQVPFADADTFQIAARSDDIFYVTKNVELHLGRLNVSTGQFTQWQTPFTSTSPGDIAVRPSDGAIFITAATMGEIGQFDDATQTLVRWTLPPDITPAGPWSFAFDAARTHVFFTAGDMNSSYIGRLDTASGELRTWTFQGAGASRIVDALDGTVLFASWDGSAPYAIVRLDPLTGVFTTWPLAAQPFYAAAMDVDGSFFFAQESSDFVGVARLVPSIGELTQWTTSGTPGDSLAILSGRVFFAIDGELNLKALDPTASGAESTIVPVTSPPISPSSYILSSTRVQLTPETAPGVTSQRTLQSQIAGPFETWSVSQVPRMKATTGGAAYFNEDGYGAIGRLTR
jgi:streptogramin lyase